MRRLTHLIVLAAFVFSCGGQWYVLQGIAWVKMIHDYSQMVPFTQAVSMTLSGQYPCEICKAIAEKKQTSDDNVCVFEKYEKKYLEPEVFSLPPSDDDWDDDEYTPVRHSPLPSRTDAPPTPPPRVALS